MFNLIYPFSLAWVADRAGDAAAGGPGPLPGPGGNHQPAAVPRPSPSLSESLYPSRSIRVVLSESIDAWGEPPACRDAPSESESIRAGEGGGRGSALSRSRAGPAVWPFYAASASPAWAARRHLAARARAPAAPPVWPFCAARPKRRSCLCTDPRSFQLILVSVSFHGPARWSGRSTRPDRNARCTARRTQTDPARRPPAREARLPAARASKFCFREDSAGLS